MAIPIPEKTVFILRRIPGTNTRTRAFSRTILKVLTRHTDIHAARWMNKQYIDGLLQDCSISSVVAMKMLQFCIKPSIYDIPVQVLRMKIKNYTSFILYWLQAWLYNNKSRK